MTTNSDFVWILKILSHPRRPPSKIHCAEAVITKYGAILAVMSCKRRRQAILVKLGLDKSENIKLICSNTLTGGTVAEIQAN